MKLALALITATLLSSTVWASQTKNICMNASRTQVAHFVDDPLDRRIDIYTIMRGFIVPTEPSATLKLGPSQNQDRGGILFTRAKIGNGGNVVITRRVDRDPKIFSIHFLDAEGKTVDNFATNCR